LGQIGRIDTLVEKCVTDAACSPIRFDATQTIIEGTAPTLKNIATQSMTSSARADFNFMAATSFRSSTQRNMKQKTPSDRPSDPAVISTNYNVLSNQENRSLNLNIFNSVTKGKNEEHLKDSQRMVSGRVAAHLVEMSG